MLKAVVDDCNNEDRAVRERQIRTWRRLKLFWEGFQRVWYSEVAHDWRIWDQEQDQQTDQSYYDRPVNVFRAYLESIIAALSVTVPPVKCYPDDADNPLDLTTAKAGDKTAALIYRHNDVPLLWLHSMFIYCTEGLVAAYHRPVKSEEFGTYTIDKNEDVTENHQISKCPNCGMVLNDQIMGPDNIIDQEKDKAGVDDSDVPIQDLLQNEGDICPNCASQIVPEISQESFVVTRLVGHTTLPKSRICIESFGGLNVKVPNYARNQKECPYLIYSYERDYSLAMEYVCELTGDKELAETVTSGNNPGSYDLYEQWGRLSTQYQGEYPINVVTEKHIWLRPGKFNVLKNDDDTKKLRKKYPNGAHVILMNDKVVWAENKSLDDDWTLSYNPLSNYIHYDPIGTLLTSIQEITNDLVSLIMQTIEHGVPLTYADPAVLDFTAYEQTEVLPGGVFPAKSKTGRALGDGFYESRTTTLSDEVMPFNESVQSMGQLVSGAIPSIFGGNLGPGASETASQYSMSRAQGMQRLNNTWKMFTLWWKNIFGKVIPLAMKEFKDDEKDVQKDTDGNFINVFIRKSELEGKIGKVELEANENLPLTWSQKKDVWMQLLQNANPQVIQLISAPENLGIMREAIGLEDVYIPGDDDRIKQYDEIKLLLSSTPINDAMTGQEVPSVEIDPDYDNHAIEFEICRKWVISEAGRLAKTENPDGYKNVLLHGKAHMMIIQEQQQQQQQQPKAKGAPPPEKPNKPDMQAAPIQGESDVQTVH